MVYETQTTLSPEEVLAIATRFFGPGGLGLTVRHVDAESATYTGPGSHVRVAAWLEGGRTTVEIETREWDQQVRQFLAQALH
jgi:hypothetical protein